MNELTEPLFNVLSLCRDAGIPGADIDITEPKVLGAYVSVLENRGIVKGDLIQAESAILDRQFFPRPFDVAEACMPFKAKRDQIAKNEEARLAYLRDRGEI